jgi:transcriptional regulator with XRE-family HTH domain
MKERRRELDISAATLAERLSLSKATIHRYENGDIQKVKLPVIEAIARELRVSALWLIGKSEIKEDGSEDDFLVMLDKLIECARDTACLIANGKQLSKEQKS